MMNKIPAVVAAALILGSAMVASAATKHKVVRHHDQAPRAEVMPNNFQGGWNVRY